MKGLRFVCSCELTLITLKLESGGYEELTVENNFIFGANHLFESNVDITLAVIANITLEVNGELLAELAKPLSEP